MRVLLVEDNAQKRRAIELALADISDIRISQAIDISIALRLVKPGLYDGVILDMTFLSRRGLDKEIEKVSLAGIEVLQYLSRRGISVPVVVATQHSVFDDEGIHMGSTDELHRMLSKAFPDNYRGIVPVNMDNEEWKLRLRALVGEFFHAA